MSGITGDPDEFRYFALGANLRGSSIAATQAAQAVANQNAVGQRSRQTALKSRILSGSGKTVRLKHGLFRACQRLLDSFGVNPIVTVQVQQIALADIFLAHLGE